MSKGKAAADIQTGVKPAGLQNLKRTAGPGRPKGSPNKVTKEGRALALGIVTDRKYLAGLRKRMIAGTAGAVEAKLWAHAFGEPKQTHAIDGDQLKQVVAALLGISAEALPDA